MKKRRILSCFLATAILLLSAVSVSATFVSPYATGKFSLDAEGGTFTRSNNTFSLEKGEEVSISGVFTPKSANLKIGILDSSTGVFYSQSATDGDIDVTMTVLKRGYYYLAVRNNSDDIVSIAGFVTY